jgi:uncharacterized protein (DUF1697 family)
VRHVAFLRAINVGGHTVRMADLRRLFESMRFGGVETFIASGNVIFESASDPRTLERRIERRLRQDLGYHVGTFIRSCADVRRIAVHQPFVAPDACSLYVVFLRETPGAEMRGKIMALRTAADDLSLHGREVYWLCRGPFRDSAAAVPLGRIVGAQGTMRNVSTVRKLAAKYPN